MKTAIIGTGFIAAYHRDALYSMGLAPDLVISRNLERARAFAPEARTAEKLTPELLDSVDCVILCTPPGEHFEIASMCLRAGKHLFCEKPLCLDPAQALELAELSENAPCVSAVDFNNRFFSGVNRLRLLPKDVCAVSGSYLQAYHVLPAPYSWRYRDPMRATTEIGSHLFDLIAYVTGEEIVSVRAELFNRTPRRVLRNGLMYKSGAGITILVENEDEASIDFTLSGGAKGHIFLSEISEGHENDLCLSLETPEGTLSWSNSEPHALSVCGESSSGGEAESFAQSFSDALHAFFTAIASGIPDPRMCTIPEAARNVLLCDAVLRSAKTGKEIRL